MTSIGSNAFINCDSLTIYCETEEAPQGWESGWKDYYAPIVWNCNNNDMTTDKEIYVVQNGVRYMLNDGVATVVRQALNIENANILPTIVYNGISYDVVKIDSSAFRNCELLTNLTIPPNITSIGTWAFENCISLTYVVIPSSVNIIGYSAFRNCGTNTTIYCEASSQPSTWNSSWASSSYNSTITIVWGSVVI